MVIFEPGTKMFPILNWGSFRAYSKSGFDSIFINDGIHASFLLKERVFAFPAGDDPFGSEFPICNKAFQDLPAGHELKSLVLTRSGIHLGGQRVQESEILPLAEKMSAALKEVFGFSCVMDYLDRKPVLVVLGLHPSFVGY